MPFIPTTTQEELLTPLINTFIKDKCVSYDSILDICLNYQDFEKHILQQLKKKAQQDKLVSKQTLLYQAQTAQETLDNQLSTDDPINLDIDENISELEKEIINKKAAQTWIYAMQAPKETREIIRREIGGLEMELDKLLSYKRREMSTAKYYPLSYANNEKLIDDINNQRQAIDEFYQESIKKIPNIYFQQLTNHINTSELNLAEKAALDNILMSMNERSDFSPERKYQIRYISLLNASLIKNQQLFNEKNDIYQNLVARNAALQGSSEQLRAYSDMLEEKYTQLDDLLQIAVRSLWYACMLSFAAVIPIFFIQLLISPLTGLILAGVLVSVVLGLVISTYIVVNEKHLNNTKSQDCIQAIELKIALDNLETNINTLKKDIIQQEDIAEKTITQEAILSRRAVKQERHPLPAKFGSSSAFFKLINVTENHDTLSSDHNNTENPYTLSNDHSQNSFVG